MADAKAIGEAHHMVDEVAKSIHRERVDHSCPEEQWGGYVSGMEGQITAARQDADGNLVLTVFYDQYAMDHEHGTFYLVLKPVDWRRVQPKPKRRKLRAKDVRANQRGRRRR